MFRSPCPPVIEIPGPLATTLGPTRNPSLIDSRRSTARNGLPPRSRTVVKPASSVTFACFIAAKARWNGVSLNLKISS